MKNLIIFSSILFMLVFATACDKDDDNTDPGPDVVAVEQFVGEYSIWNTEEIGIITFYDSIGNQIGQGIDTLEFESPLLEISFFEDTDTLLVDGLQKSWNESNLFSSKALFQNDTLHLLFDNGTSTNNNYIRGDIWLSGDSIYLDYRWNTSDTWSTGALPVYGEVFARGVQL